MVYRVRQITESLRPPNVYPTYDFDDENLTVLQLKGRIQSCTNIPIEHQLLFFGPYLLTDDQKPLSEYSSVTHGLTTIDLHKKIIEDDCRFDVTVESDDGVPIATLSSVDPDETVLSLKRRIELLTRTPRNNKYSLHMHDVELRDEDCLRDFSDTARPTVTLVATERRPSVLTLVTEERWPVSNPGGSGGGGGSSKTGYRTKFTQEQKEKMLGFAEGIEWRIWKEEEEEEAVQRFCDEIGVQLHVFKTWMINNKARRLSR